MSGKLNINRLIKEQFEFDKKLYTIKNKVFILYLIEILPKSW